MTLYELVRRVIAARKTPVVQLAIVIAAVVIAAAIRWFIDKGSYGLPFATFIPVVVLSAIFLEWPYAVLAGLASLATVGSFFAAYARIQLTVANVLLWVAFAFIASFMIATGHVLRRTILELDAQSEKIRAFNAELQRRTKNTLQMVRTAASRAAGSTDPVEFYRTLAGRLDAIAKANELLGYGSLQACDLGDLVRAAIQPFNAWSIDASGPPCQIAGEPAMQLVMALHELGTNAEKYGALSTECGRVAISWIVNGGEVQLLWRESGGPRVAPPTEADLGTRVLTPGGALRAVDLDYRPEGLAGRLTIAATVPA